MVGRKIEVEAQLGQIHRGHRRLARRRAMRASSQKGGSSG
jgi:hypothetical protein